MMNRRLGSITLVCCIVTGCSGGPPPPPADPTPVVVPAPTPTRAPREDLTPHCEGILNTYECGEVIERYQRERAPRRVLRNGDTLKVVLAHADQAIFTDHDVDDENGVWYTYREFIPDVEYHVIQVHLYEGNAFQIVSHATGDLVRLHAVPEFSPDGRRFATASEDLDSGYNPTAIQIWLVAENAIVLEWQLQPAGDPVVITPDAWGPVNLRWISPSEIRVQRVTFDRELLTRTVGDDVAIRLVAGRWRVVGAN